MKPARCLWLVAGLLSAAQAQAATETYTIDSVHSQVLFFIDHAGFSTSEGEFHAINGQVVFDNADWSRCSVSVQIETDSLDMDDAEWNTAVKAKNFFNVAQYPTMTFRSTQVEKTGDGAGKVHGNLTLLGVTKPVVIDFRFNKAAFFAAQNRYKSGFSGTTRIKRSDFGMTALLNIGIGDEVDIRLEIEAFRE